MTPKFSICIITKNGANTLPRLFKSLEEFKRRGGEVCILDTGSTDTTYQLCKGWGARVVLDKQFTKTIHSEEAKKINKKYVFGGEPDIVEEGSKLFNFSAARNYISAMAKNDMICTLDDDEAYTTFDIDAINAKIEEGYEQFEYQFVFAHDSMGRPAIQFVQSKFFDRRKVQWEGVVHEVLQGAANLMYLDETIIKLEHYQEGGKEHRGNYLVGLAYDCYQHPAKDRQSHYFARELMYSGRYRSAAHEFERHIAMDRWNAEKAQSYIYLGRCQGHIGGNELRQQQLFMAAYACDSSRREGLMELANFYRYKDNKVATAAFASAALEIPYNTYFANEKRNYEDFPHALLYWAKGWLGDIPAARTHILKALEFDPYNVQYLADTKYYFEYPDNGITGWMVFDELQWLYNTSQRFQTIVEVGSWKGKSTHALASGAGKHAGSTVYCIDTWKGSSDPLDATNWLAKEEDVFAQFKSNILAKFDNVIAHKVDSADGPLLFDDSSIGMCFIDASHTKEALLRDLRVWLPKMRGDGIICGHDYLGGTWMGVVEAVNETFGKEKVKRAGYSIWYVEMKDFTGDEYRKMVDGIDYVEARPMFLKMEKYMESTKIPKKIYTAWFGGNMPDVIKTCIDSQQKVAGYEHEVFSENNLPTISEYLNKALKAKKWVKATDYLRWYVLYTEGGIFLDADVQIIDGKNFDAFLDNEMFLGEEMSTADGIVLGCAVLGAEKGHPLLERILAEVVRKFQGDDELHYESSMELLNDLGRDYQEHFTRYPSEIFYPWNWREQRDNLTKDSVTWHHFLRTWTPEVQEAKLWLKQIEDNYSNTFGEKMGNLLAYGHPDGLKSTYNIILDKLRKQENFVFLKRGDGEEACMNGEVGQNCDGVMYTSSLAVALRYAFIRFNNRKNSFVVKFEDQKNYNCLLHRVDNDPSEFFKEIIRSTRKKVYIGPQRLSLVPTILNCFEFVRVPENSAAANIEEILGDTPKGADIYLISAGLAAKVIIHKLWKDNPNATYIDVGSSFDPLAGQTRTNQMVREHILGLYDWKVDRQGHIDTEDERYAANMKLTQEDHPEAKWVRDQVYDYEKSVIDVGCGTNKTLKRAVGIDIRHLPGHGLDYLGDMDLSAVGGDFDVIISRHSLEHGLDQQKIIKGWIQHLKDNSKILVVLPDHEYIDTMDKKYGNGEHLHAYTRESFRNFLSLFPVFYISKQETVLEKWSFGTTIHYNLPRVCIIIPHIKGTREDSLQRLLQSIKELNYPFIDIIVEEGNEETVPVKVNRAAKEAWQDVFEQPDIFCYIGDDCEFEPDALLRAVEMTKKWGLVAFNSGPLLPDKGNICEHFIITAQLYRKLGHKIFDERLHHCGVDNLLWHKAAEEAVWCQGAKVKHYAGDRRDPIYEKGWAHVQEDRKLLAQLLNE